MIITTNETSKTKQPGATIVRKMITTHDDERDKRDVEDMSQDPVDVEVGKPIDVLAHKKPGRKPKKD